MVDSPQCLETLNLLNQYNLLSKIYGHDAHTISELDHEPSDCGESAGQPTPTALSLSFWTLKRYGGIRYQYKCHDMLTSSAFIQGPRDLDSRRFNHERPYEPHDLDLEDDLTQQEKARSISSAWSLAPLGHTYLSIPRKTTVLARTASIVYTVTGSSNSWHLARR
ncbi:hypothetical protein BDN72DRAFT_834829 [Pluteus cervinus]|uniref:Uncharacterized protein n=1 Tax=Pluteus cervinus TaxID=181527 RepID=A0ACD3B8U5_9AGAR|nr:hypothetical protein BDN72DRAFT_834829 [Pluteus cervinus]